MAPTALKGGVSTGVGFTMNRNNWQARKTSLRRGCCAGIGALSLYPAFSGIFKGAFCQKLPSIWNQPIQ
jgi:hypothetical protein